MPILLALNDSGNFWNTAFYKEICPTASPSRWTTRTPSMASSGGRAWTSPGPAITAPGRKYYYSILTLSLNLSFSLSIYLSLSLSIYLSLFLSSSLSLCLYASLSLSLGSLLSNTLFLHRSLFLSLSLYWCLIWCCYYLQLQSLLMFSDPVAEQYNKNTAFLDGSGVYGDNGVRT